MGPMTILLLNLCDLINMLQSEAPRNVMPREGGAFLHAGSTLEQKRDRKRSDLEG